MNKPRTVTFQKHTFYLGEEIGFLKIIDLTKYYPNKDWKPHVKCACLRCGKTTLVSTSNLARRVSQSCGCTHFKQNGLIAGNPEEYSVWNSMMQRCYNIKNPRYLYYGERGIKVVENWHRFGNFLSDMGERPSKQFSLDRIDNEGDYSPTNCRWATNLEQVNNKRNNVLVTHKGITQSIANWSRLTGISYMCLYKRHKRGWSPEQMFKGIDIW